MKQRFECRPPFLVRQVTELKQIHICFTLPTTLFDSFAFTMQFFMHFFSFEIKSKYTFLKLSAPGDSNAARDDIFT